MKTLKIKQQITSRTTDSVDKYLKDISKIELLSTEEEVILATRIKKGDTKALENLVNSNLRFVISVAKQYQNQGLNLPDLISEGNIGLIKAANRFDSTKGFKFISYAVWWIRQTILQALAENSRIVRLPVNKVGAANKVNKMFVKLMQEFEREPTTHEIANALSIDAELVKELLASSERPAYLEAPVSSSDEKLRLIDLISSESINEDVKYQDDIKYQIDQLLLTLNERDLTIVKMYYGIDFPYRYTLDEIAKNFGLTRERIRQLKTKAMRKLKTHAQQF
ncbi:MAG: RNA polymerase sigma factor RpoD/SigA [Bacteroidales bacterium]|nr:RNA polymerase sigma factor RpoD/SigA [Bacteroidales bacterium]